MRNLLNETLSFLKRKGKDVAHVQWVGSDCGAYAITWDEFALIAQDLEYDAGFGTAEIMRDLVVVGSGWWLERFEYDGSEGWAFKSGPTKREGRPFNKVMREKWESDIHDLMTGERE